MTETSISSVSGKFGPYDAALQRTDLWSRLQFNIRWLLEMKRSGGDHEEPQRIVESILDQVRPSTNQQGQS